MPIISIPEKHVINKITEIRNLSDAKYYIFILLLSDMKQDKTYRPNHLDLVQYDSFDIEEIQKTAMYNYSREKDFQCFVEYYCPCDFYHIANYIDKHTIEVEKDHYKLEIPNGNINVIFETNNANSVISNHKGGAINEHK